MSEWNHRICADCYIAKAVIDQEFREPVRMKPEATPYEEPCCFCGIPIINVVKYGGIYIRHDPAELECTHTVGSQTTGNKKPFRIHDLTEQ